MRRCILSGIVRHHAAEGTGLQATIYTSTEPAWAHEASPALKACLGFADDCGYVVVGEFADVRVLGADLERPGLWAAIESLASGAVLLVPHLGVLPGSFHESCVIEAAVVEAGARIVSAIAETDWPDTTPNRLLRGQIRLFSAWARAGRTCRRGYAKKLPNARVEAPFGWRHAWPAPGGLRPIEAEQYAIAMACLLRKQGVGLREIARRLESAGCPARGKRWHHSSVRRILNRACLA